MPLSSEDIGNLWPQAAYTVLIVALAVFAGLRLARPGRVGAAGGAAERVIGRPVAG